MKFSQNTVSAYFTFSKKQRNGIFFALAIMFACLGIRFGYRFFMETKSVPVDTAFFEKVAKIKKSDSNTYANNYSNNEKPYTRRYNDNENGATSYPSKFTPKGELFNFDPNTLDADGWKRLGVREKTVQTIQKYIAKGGRFKQAEDIKKVYGLFPDQIERLMPFVKIATDNKSNAQFEAKNPAAPVYNKPTYTTRPPSTIDINVADTTAFIALPGIGSKLAMRIVSFREKLGGFVSAEQIKEIYGLQDSVFQKIKTRFMLGSLPIKQLNVNSADANTLKQHPYLKWNLANAIVQYRTQHGNFTSLDDLRKIAILDAETFNKVKPYLTL